MLRWQMAFAVMTLVAYGCSDSNTTVTPKPTPDAGTVTQDTGSTTPEDTGSTTPEDTGAPDTGATDAGTAPDVAAEDVEQDSGSTPDVPTGACPGGAGCACEADGDCNTGKCIETPEGNKCAQPCSGDTPCPGGYACKTFGSGDTSSYCAPNFLTTCMPCNANADCKVNGVDALCLDYGAAGKFCGGTCTQDSDCPSGGYLCVTIKDDGTGKESKQCKLKPTVKDGSNKECAADADCSKGESCIDKKCKIVEQTTCGCSAYAKSAGLSTSCSVSNDLGTCTGTRKCAADGLTACSAKTPAEEICNGEDDNCDGKVDFDPKMAPCFKAAWKNSGSKAPCKADADCTTAGESCADDGTCRELIGQCPGKAQCLNGKETCDASKTPKIEQCNGEDDDCDLKVDEDFAYTTPAGATLTYGDNCGEGACKGGTVVCKDLLTAVCSTDVKASPEKGACDNVDNDCNGKVDDLACDDGNVCTDDACDSTAKKCSNNANTAECDDKNPCTEQDVCAATVCAGTQKDCGDQCSSCDSKTGNCVNAKDGTSCSDGNACTLGDACGTDAGGKFGCQSGLDAKQCDDGNLCTDDVCDTKKGCDYVNNAASQACYSGGAGTQGKGVCIGGKQLCKDGKLDSICTGEIVPSQSEACDGKDDNCNGTTDEGCKPTSVAVTFSSAYVSGKSGNLSLQMLVGPSGPVGKATGTGKYSVDFGFLSWLMSLFK